MDNNFEIEISNLYSHSMLMDLYKRYLNKLELLIPGSFAISMEIQESKTNKSSKEYLIRLLMIVFTNKNLFEKFLNLLPEKIKKVFAVLVNENSDFNSETIGNKIGEKIFFNIKNSDSEHSLIHLLFQVKTKKNIRGEIEPFISLPPAMREKLKPFILPGNSDTLSESKLPEDISVYQNSDKILKEILIIMDRINSLNLSFNQQFITSKNNVSAIKKDLNFDEFYNSKELDNIRINLVISFLYQLKTVSLKIESLTLLKKLFEEYISPESKFFSYTLLQHLKFSANYLKSEKDKTKNSNFNNSMFFVLKNLPFGKWVSFENIYNFTMQKKLKVKLIGEFLAKEFYWTGQTKNKNYISISDYDEVIVKPLIRASLFLFASFGLINLGFDEPINKLKTEGSNYLTVFDGIKFVRLTKLGAYVAGLTENYYSKAREAQTELIFDDKNLLIYLSEKDNNKSIILNNFADEINEITYKVNFSSFLKNCKNRDDVENKIALFKEQVNKTPGENWLEFFQDLIDKTQLLTKQENIIIYKVTDNQELAELIFKDEILNQYILKVENMQIAFYEKDLEIIAKRISEFGFLL